MAEPFSPFLGSYTRIGDWPTYWTTYWGGLPWSSRIEDTPGDDVWTGTDAPERFGGNSGNDVAYGMGGNDYLEGGNGFDTLYGGNGDDFLDPGNQADISYGGPGDDVFLVYNNEDTLIEFAGEGFDTVLSAAISYTLPDNIERIMLAASSGVTAYGNALDNIVEGNGLNNFLYGLEGNDLLFGAEGDDVLDGGAGNDRLFGESGVDILGGGDGADQLDGGEGADSLSGGVGDDLLRGGQGNDTIDGGVGTDTASYSGNFAGYIVVRARDDSGAIVPTTYRVIDIDPSDGDDGSDIVTNVGLLQFADQRITLPLALSVFTNDQIAYQLTNIYWGGAARHWAVAPGGTITVNLTALTTDGQFLAREALNLWTDATRLVFSEVTTGGQIVFDDNQDGAFATSIRNGDLITAAFVNVSTAWLTTNGTTLRTYSFQTYVHEIGHALGLGHAGGYNGSAAYPGDADYLNDSWASSVMSYFDQTNNTYVAGLGFTDQYSVTPMVADLIAIANLYGSNGFAHLGDTTYGFNNNSDRAVFTAIAGQPALAYTIIDGAGTDTLDYSGYTANQRIDLNPEAFSNVGGGIGNVSIARGTQIENAIGGSGDDILIGNGSANQLTSGGGTDQFFGKGGDDTIILNAGTGPTSPGASGIYNGGTGIDTLQLESYVAGGFSYFDLSSASLISIERLSFASIAGTQLMGEFTLNQVLLGGLLEIAGGAGTDFLKVTSATVADMIMPNFILVTWSTTIDSDMLILSTQLASGATLRARDGLAAVQRLSGYTGSDILIGSSGTDILDGFGGIDDMRGNGGNDRLLISASGVGSLIDGGTGIDTLVISGAVTSIGALAGIEAIEFSAGSTLTLTGSQFANGLAADSLISGSGTLFVGMVAGQYLFATQMIFSGGAGLTVIGTEDIDVIKGPLGTAMTVSAAGGTDQIRGGNLGDIIDAGNGNDKIMGLGGGDQLTGGAGADQFRYLFASDSGLGANADRILDFTNGSDKLDFRLLDADPVAAGRQALSFIGTSAFAVNGSAQVRYADSGADTLVQIDLNGDGAVDMEIVLAGHAGQALAGTDFLF